MAALLALLAPLGYIAGCGVTNTPTPMWTTDLQNNI